MLRPYLSAMAIAVKAPLMRWRNTPIRLTRVSGRPRCCDATSRIVPYLTCFSVWDLRPRAQRWDVV